MIGNEGQSFSLDLNPAGAIPVVHQAFAPVTVKVKIARLMLLGRGPLNHFRRGSGVAVIVLSKMLDRLVDEESGWTPDLLRRWLLVKREEVFSFFEAGYRVKMRLGCDQCLSLDVDHEPPSKPYDLRELIKLDQT